MSYYISQMDTLKDQSSQLVAKFNAGQSCSSLAKEYGVKYIRMWRVLNDAGALFRGVKLSAADEAALLADYQSGLASIELGKKYGIAQASVCNYIRRNGIEPHDYYRKGTVKSNIFKVLTPESLWLLGWFYSDGNVSKSSNRFGIVVHANDEGVLRKIQRAMEFTNDNLYRSKRQKSIEVYGTDAIIHTDLISLGCIPAKSLIIRYPKQLIEGWQHWPFLRGILEGDGNIGFKAGGNRPGFNCEFASGSLGFLQDIATLLKTELNIDTSIRERANSNSKRLILRGGREPILRFLDLLYKDAPPENRLDRKYEIYLKMHKVNLREPTYDHVNRDKQVEGFFLSPEGVIYHARGMKKFSREMGISIGCVLNLLKTRKNRFKSRKYGWSKPTQDQIDAARAAGTLVTKFY